MLLATSVQIALTSSILGFILGLLIGIFGSYAYWVKEDPDE